VLGSGTGGDLGYVTAAAGKETNLNLQAVLIVPASGVVKLECAASGSMSWGRAKLDALAVGAAHLPPS
jgi:hypothetical protein